ncbi:MAG: DsbA family protein [Solirubrobacteraceae bacterium]
MPPAIQINEFTDPGCPWAWSAEPVRRRIDWLFGDAVEWRLHMVGLSESPEEYLEKGFTPQKMASGMATIAREHHMPIATHERPRMAATLPACRAIVAAREHGGERLARTLLRQLRVRHFGGGLLDDPHLIEAAAHDAGIDAAMLHGWLADPAVEDALRADMAAARKPAAAALALDHKLADAENGRRYTCPSYELIRLADGLRVAIPGFHPFGVYEVALANMLPGHTRRPEPVSVEEALTWAGEPLATVEVAELMGLSLEGAREELGRVAVETHLGFDGLWTLPRYRKLSIAPSSDDASEATASASVSSPGA